MGRLGNGEAARERLKRQRAQAQMPVGLGLLPELGRDYRPLMVLASGGMAQVFLAWDVGVQPKRLCAIKRMLPHLANQEQVVRMFEDECRLALRLDHPHIVRTYAAGRSPEGLPFLAMEYLAGLSAAQMLDELRKRGERLPLPFALAIARQVAAALHWAHELKGPDGASLQVVHRDVNPPNVIVTWSGDVKLLDFGIAHATARLAQTQVGTYKGKAEYLAPEQVRGRGVDGRADQFAAGALLFELLTSRKMFASEHAVAAMSAIVSASRPSLREARPDAPIELDEVLRRATDPDRDERYPSMEVFAAALASAGRLDGPAQMPSATELGSKLTRLFPEARERSERLLRRLRGEAGTDGPLLDAASVQPTFHGDLPPASGDGPGAALPADGDPPFLRLPALQAASEASPTGGARRPQRSPRATRAAGGGDGADTTEAGRAADARDTTDVTVPLPKLAPPPGTESHPSSAERLVLPPVEGVAALRSPSDSPAVGPSPAALDRSGVRWLKTPWALGAAALVCLGGVWLFRGRAPSPGGAPRGELTLRSEPPGATAYLDGAPLPWTTPLVLGDVPLGHHRLELRAPGTAPQERTFDLTIDAPRAVLDVALRPIAASLALTVVPAHAQVILDGRPVTVRDGGVALIDGLPLDAPLVLRVAATGYESETSVLRFPEATTQTRTVALRALDDGAAFRPVAPPGAVSPPAEVPPPAPLP